MSQREANNPADPWSIDYFNPPTQNVQAPAPVKRAPKLLPEVNRLFALQDDLVRAVNALDALEHQFHGKEPKGWRELRQNVQNAYKVANRYLKEFGTALATP